MNVVFDDGGRAEAGFRGKAGDCVTRSIAIVTGRPYVEVYEALSDGMRSQRERKSRKRRGSARDGVTTNRKWFKDYMRSLGFEWVPTMGIGTGCKVHLADGELPMGRLVVSVSRHYTAVIDGVIYDTHDPQREPEEFYHYEPDGTTRKTVSGGRCVYGYWRLAR